MCKKLFFLLSLGLMTASLAACDGGSDSDGDAACKGKSYGDACDANDASKKCAGGLCLSFRYESCEGKVAMQSCGEDRVCNEWGQCMPVIQSGSDRCKGKYEGAPCGGDKTCRMDGSCKVEEHCHVFPCNDPCVYLNVGDVCVRGVCGDAHYCVPDIYIGDDVCIGKFVGYACDASDASKVCNGKGECGAPLPCDNKGYGASCGDNLFCNLSGECVKKITAGNPRCIEKFVGDACTMGDDDKGKCNEEGACVESSGPRVIRYRGSDAGHVNANISDADLATFVKGQYDLNFELFRADNTLDGSNAMISTFSIQTALGMVWAGAAGDTKSQMASALHFDAGTHDALNKLNTDIRAKNKPASQTDSETVDAIEIKTSNNLYAVRSGWKDSWLKVLDQSYDAGITELDFATDPEAARTYINQVVSKDTHGRIKNLIPAGGVSVNTKSVLTNSIYLKAPWNPALHVEAGEMQFHADANGAKTVPALTVPSYSLLSGKGADCVAVSVPLRDDAFHVLFVMPDEGKFDDVWNALDGDKISGIFAGMDRKDLRLTFPKIEFTTPLSLNDPLKSLGMTDAFDEAKADFSAMSDLDLYIGLVVHKSFIAMDEKGVEAAAATAVAMDETASAETDTLDIDRPYIFVIYETESRAPLFVGRVLDPSKK